MHLSDSAVGFISVVGAIIFFGSFGVPLKLKSVQDAKVDPVVYQLYYSIAIFLSTWLVLIFVPLEFTYWGILSACLWVPASALSLVAINFAGLSVAVGVWAGLTIVVSFIWGAVAFPHAHPIGNLVFSLIGLGLLVVGIVGLSFSNTSFVHNLFNFSSNKRRNINYDGPEASSSENYFPNEESSLLSATQKQGNDEDSMKFVKGILCALGVGLLNGSVMVPMNLAPKKYAGLPFALSFAIGAILATTVMFIIYAAFTFFKNGKIPDFAPRVALIPGLLSGIIWNAGNICSILATTHLGMTVGYPLTQVCLVISGLWGILVFREITKVSSLIVWFGSLAILGGGVALLAVFGTKH